MLPVELIATSSIDTFQSLLVMFLNFLIELAIAGNSNIIVTNNIKDIEGAELTFDELKILKPEQLLRGNWLWPL